jgi:hypothetical protein
MLTFGFSANSSGSQILIFLTIFYQARLSASKSAFFVRILIWPFLRLPEILCLSVQTVANVASNLVIIPNFFLDNIYNQIPPPSHLSLVYPDSDVCVPLCCQSTVYVTSQRTRNAPLVCSIFNDSILDSDGLLSWSDTQGDYYDILILGKDLTKNSLNISLL